MPVSVKAASDVISNAMRGGYDVQYTKRFPSGTLSPRTIRNACLATVVLDLTEIDDMKVLKPELRVRTEVTYGTDPSPVKDEYYVWGDSDNFVGASHSPVSS